MVFYAIVDYIIGLRNIIHIFVDNLWITCGIPIYLSTFSCLFYTYLQKKCFLFLLFLTVHKIIPIFYFRWLKIITIFAACLRCKQRAKYTKRRVISEF